jgi:ADP-heptose:LPS heptosyltransferase
MENIVIKNDLALGDNIALTGAIRDLCRTYPGRYNIGVKSHFEAVYKYNPYVDNSISGRLINVSYMEDLRGSNKKSMHIIEAYRRSLEGYLGVSIDRGESKGEIYLSNKEKEFKSIINGKYWVIDCGGKYDCTTKWWSQEKAQEVVDYFGDITFVQVGDKAHYHPKLDNVVNLIGKTTIRDLFLLIYHSSGVVCPITSHMHIAAALPKVDRIKPVVVIAGGIEAIHWSTYSYHTILHTIGAMDCCAFGGCWRRQVVPIEDGKIYEEPSCKYPVKSGDTYIAKCMDSISSVDVIMAIEKYEGFSD